MDISLYSSASQAFVIVPDCFQPSSESHRLYGPLVLYKTIKIAPSKSTAWSKILLQIETLSYAVVDVEDMENLLKQAVKM